MPHVSLHRSIVVTLVFATAIGLSGCGGSTGEATESSPISIPQANDSFDDDVLAVSVEAAFVDAAPDARPGIRGTRCGDSEYGHVAGMRTCTVTVVDLPVDYVVDVDDGDCWTAKQTASNYEPEVASKDWAELSGCL